MEAVSCCSSLLCISNLLGAMGKMLILATLCNYSEVTGVNAHVQYSANWNLALCCLKVFSFFFFFFPLPVNSIAVALIAMLLLQ